MQTLILFFILSCLTNMNASHAMDPKYFAFDSNVSRRAHEEGKYLLALTLLSRSPSDPEVKHYLITEKKWPAKEFLRFHNLIKTKSTRTFASFFSDEEPTPKALAVIEKFYRSE